MHHRLCLILLYGLLGCRAPDYTRGESGICEVHQLTMQKRTVPIAYGLIPMSKTAAEQGEWHRRQTLYPHPGDCLPAADINIHGEQRALVFVCPQCARISQRPRVAD